MGYILYKVLSYPANVVFALLASLIIILFAFARPLLKQYFGPKEPDLDFVYLLLHMLVLSTGKAPNTKIVEAVSDERAYKKYAKYFKKIYSLAKEYGYSLPDACVLVSREAGRGHLKDFLERYSSVVSVGGDVERFLESEFRNSMNMYEYIYGRIIDSLRMILGSYAAIMTSAVFIMINFMILSFFFGGDISILIVAFIGVYTGIAMLGVLIYKMMPKDIYVNREGIEIPLYKKIKAILLTDILIAALLVAYYLFDGTSINAYILVSIIGGILILPGFLLKRLEGFILDIDRDFPIFSRMYGNHLSLIPSVIKALEPILITELGKLVKVLKRLYSMLVNHISPDISFRLFSLTTGSELVRRGMIILGDAVKYGADMVKTGSYLSEVATMIIRTRRLKFQVFKTFESTILILHATGIVLMAFTVVLLGIFADFLAKIPTILPFSYIGPGLIEGLVISMVVMLTIVNAIVLTIVNRGFKQTFVYYLGILMLISGITMYASEHLINILIGEVFQETISTITSIPTL
jgi:flagellar protein FlaJ